MGITPAKIDFLKCFFFSIFELLALSRHGILGNVTFIKCTTVSEKSKSAMQSVPP